MKRKGRNTNRRARKPAPLSLKGGKLRTPSDPKPITRIPWNKLTLALSGFTGADAIVISTLHAAANAQLGLTNANFEMKIQSVRAWGPVSPTNDNFTEIAVGDIIDDEDNGQFEPLAIISDLGNLGRRAAVGYVWPLAMRGNVIVSSASNNVKLMECTNVSVLYVNILWKPRFVDTREFKPLVVN